MGRLVEPGIERAPARASRDDLQAEGLGPNVWPVHSIARGWPDDDGDLGEPILYTFEPLAKGVFGRVFA